MEKETLTIYYDDFTNSFEDEYGTEENSLIGIMTDEDMVHCKQVGGTYYREVDNVRYELVFPRHDDKRVFYYDIESNLMYDEDGITMFNIFSVIRPSALYLFKKKKETMMFTTISGGSVELIWPDCLP